MIEARNLSKRYGEVEAVRGVSFSIEAGQVVGLLGPNGAGKTTIMKMIAGYHFPSSGDVLVDGVSVVDSPVEVKKRIGYLPESAPLYGEMRVSEYLTFIAATRDVESGAVSSRLKSVLADCGLTDVSKKRIDELSKGYRQRVGLAQALIGDPPILILDEPTAGLDPNQIIEMRSLIGELGKRKTVILSTHILQEVEAVCSTVLIVNEGRIAAQGNTARISSSLKGGEVFEVSVKGASPESVRSSVRSLPGLLDASGFEGPDESGAISIVLTLSPRDGYSAGEVIFDWALSSGLKLLTSARRKTSLEDVFVKITRENAGS